MSGHINGVVDPSKVTEYIINYNEPNQNQFYGQTSLYFYPDIGVVQKYSYNTPVGDLYGYLDRYIIVH